MLKPPNLSPNQRAVLEALVAACREDSDFCCLNFDALSERAGLDRKLVRRACRYLARKALAEFQKGLWTDCGEPAGAGYGATPAGVELVKQLEAVAS